MTQQSEPWHNRRSEYRLLGECTNADCPRRDAGEIDHDKEGKYALAE
jgi:hypothetical protein